LRYQSACITTGGIRELWRNAIVNGAASQPVNAARPKRWLVRAGKS
jgi:hypothetical protein